MSDDLVSIVVAFHDEARTIEKCVESLCRQQVDGWCVELVLVDDGSSDGSASRLPEDPALRIVRQERAGAYGARNHGVRLATGSVIAFTDADCIPQEGWLEALLDELSDPNTLVVLGRRVAGSGSHGLGLLLAYEHARDAFVLEGDRPELYYGHTNNMATRREVLERHGPFIERMRGSDTVFVRRVVDAHGCDAVRYRSDALITHLEVGGLGAYYRKVFTYGRHRRLTARLGSATPLSTRDRVEVARLARIEIGADVRTSLRLRMLLAGGVLAWWVGSLSAYIPGRFGRGVVPPG